MTEKVLRAIKRNTKKVYCIMDGELIENLTFSQLQSLLSQIGQHGSIRRNIAIFDHPLKQEEHKKLIKIGISPIIVSSEKDMHLSLECLDACNKEIDILCLGIVNEVLLPVVIFARETTEIIIVSPTESLIESYRPYLDFQVILKNIY